MFPLPKVNYCQVKDYADQMPIIGPIMEELKQFGNIIQNCPLKKGHYYLRDAYLDDTAMQLEKTWFQNRKKYMVQATAMEEITSPPTFLFKLSIKATFFVNKGIK
jgi:hypothetical protein